MGQQEIIIVLRKLKGQWITAQQITDRSNCNYSAVFRSLQAMLKFKEIIRRTLIKHQSRTFEYQLK